MVRRQGDPAMAAAKASPGEWSQQESEHHLYTCRSCGEKGHNATQCANEKAKGRGTKHPRAAAALWA